MAVAQPSNAGTATVDGPTAAASGSGAISGQVTGTLNNGLPGATVTLYEQGGNTAVATTTTDRQGAYTFSGIQAGDYRVEATHNGTSEDQTAEVVAGKTNSVNIVVTSSSTGTGSIAGLVMDTQNNPLAGASVTLYEQNSDTVVATTTANSKGDYTFSGVQAGDYRVEATSNGDDGQATGIVLDGKTSTINVAIKTSGSSGDGSISGLVTDAQNNPITGATVTLYEQNSQTSVASTTTDQQGEYTFSGIDEGDYRVEASHNGNTGSAPVTVQANKDTDANIVVTQSSAQDIDVTATSQTATVQPGDTFQVTYEYTNKQGSPASAGRIELTTPANVTATSVSGDGTSGLGGSPQAVLYGFSGSIDSGETLTTTVTYEVDSDQPVSTTETVEATAYLQNSGDTDTSTTQVDVVSSSSPAQQYDTNGQSGIQPGEAQTAIVDLNSGTIGPQKAQAVVAALNNGSS